MERHFIWRLDEGQVVFDRLADAQTSALVHAADSGFREPELLQNLSKLGRKAVRRVRPRP